MTLITELLSSYSLPENFALQIHRRKHVTHPFVVRMFNHDTNTAVLLIGSICFQSFVDAHRWCIKEADRSHNTTVTFHFSEVAE